MSGFGAIVKRIAEAMDRAADAAERGLRDAIAASKKPKPCPVYVHDKPARRHR